MRAILSGGVLLLSAMWSASTVTGSCDDISAADFVNVQVSLCVRTAGEGARACDVYSSCVVACENQSIGVRVMCVTYGRVHHRLVA